MHAREMVELAALVASHGPVLVEGRGELSPAGLEQYWAASRCRLERWQRSLKEFARPASANSPSREDLSRQVSDVLEEVFTGEVLTRVFTALLAAYDRSRGQRDAESIGRSIFLGHLEARARALRTLIDIPCLDSHQVLVINRTRRRVERWTDLLLGYMTGVHDVSRFAHDPQRAQAFANELHRQPHGFTGWSVVLASLRATFQKTPASDSPNADSNAQIATSVLACLGPATFDSSGLFPSLWVTRLMSTAVDAQVLISDLFAADAAPAFDGVGLVVRAHSRPSTPPRRFQ